MGTDPYAIQRLMGHKTFSTTQGYAHHYSESLKKAMEALDPNPDIEKIDAVSPLDLERFF
jgi:site-specific recombinase XerD